ncbi:MAG: hypothetical protein BWY91_02914 [bacterium ADurb.BinA028]|nr:MAG: hypothetical protein BWY91_02914 [bacterium ADurb.BinA028]
MLSPTLLNSTERKTATPSVPPIWRKKVAALVAIPMSRGSTTACTARVSGCMVLPSPRPKRNINAMTPRRSESALIRESISNAMTMSRTPTMGKIRTLPVLVIN